MKRLLLILFAIFILVSPVQGEFFKDIIVTSPTGIWTDSRAYTTLGAAVTAIGASEQDLYIAKEEVVTTLVIPANIRLHFLKDGAIANSNTLTLNTKNIHADHQIFTGAGAVNFTPGTEVQSVWFEDFETAITQTSNDTVTLLINKIDTLLNSAVVGNNVLLKWNSYNLITIAAGQTLSNIGDISAPSIRLFTISGAITFRASSSIQEIDANWFGSSLTTLGLADTAATTAGKSLTFSGPWVIDTDLTLSSHIKALSGTDLQIATTKTLTINGPLSAGLYQIFSCTGTGKVVFGDGSVDFIRPEWGNATGTGSAAMQWAIDTAAASVCKKIKLTSSAYTFTTPINVTSTAAIDRSGIVVEGLGRRGGTTIYADTGNILFELTGSAYTSWPDIYIVHGPTNPSTVAFFMAGTAAKPNCQHHDFTRTYVELYKADITGLTYGTVGYVVVGSEENTWSKTQTYASTPFIFTAYYSQVSAEYPSYFLPLVVQAGHSCGVNTFSGENSLVTYDKKCPNIVLYSANTLDCGNMYLSNVEIGTNSTNQTAIKMLGGTLESLRGRFKIEGPGTLLELTGGIIPGWDIVATYGAMANATVTDPVVLIHVDAATIFDMQNLNLRVAYYDPTAVPFVGKPIFGTTGTPNLTPVLANFDVKVNQTQAQYNAIPFPAWFVGVVRNFNLRWADAKYFLDGGRHVLTTASHQIYLGAGDETTPVDIAQIILPAITPNFSARSIALRAKGLLSACNASGGAGEADMTNCYFDTTRGAYSVKDGAIVIGTTGTESDSLLAEQAVTAVSSDGGAYQFTGVDVNMVYNAGTRIVQLNALPVGTGTNLAGVNAFLHNLELELQTCGRLQELIYLK